MESELLHWTNYVITAVLNYTGPYFLHKFVKKKKREKKAICFLLGNTYIGYISVISANVD